MHSVHLSKIPMKYKFMILGGSHVDLFNSRVIGIVLLADLTALGEASDSGKLCPGDKGMEIISELRRITGFEAPKS